MQAITVRELQERADEIVRRVRNQNEAIEVVDEGVVVARLTPARWTAEEMTIIEGIWEEEDRLAAEISALWPVGLSAADAIAADRE